MKHILFLTILFLSLSSETLYRAGPPVTLQSVPERSAGYRCPVVAGASYTWSRQWRISYPGRSVHDSATVQWGNPGTGTIIVSIHNPNNTVTYYTLNVVISIPSRIRS
jgi:hypothetical protein